MSGTIVCDCTTVPLAHDGSTAGDHPVVAGWLSPVYCTCSWLLGTCVNTGCPLGTQYLSLYHRGVVEIVLYVVIFCCMAFKTPNFMI